MTPTPQPWNPHYATDAKALELRLSGLTYEQIGAQLGMTADEAESAASLVADDTEFARLLDLDQPDRPTTKTTSAPLTTRKAPTMTNTVRHLANGYSDALALHKRAQAAVKAFAPFLDPNSDLNRDYTPDARRKKREQHEQTAAAIAADARAWQDEFDQRTRDQLANSHGIPEPGTTPDGLMRQVLDELRAAREWQPISHAIDTTRDQAKLTALVHTAIDSLPADTLELHLASLAAKLAAHGNTIDEYAGQVHARRLDTNPAYRAAQAARDEFEAHALAIDTTVFYMNETILNESRTYAELIDHPFGQSSIVTQTNTAVTR